MSSLHEYTLLIVESESVASIIRQFDIPYLEVIATNGFCWIPSYNWKKNKLEIRANPAQLPVRKLLKEKAPWASRTVIATDSDSAGEFIAYSLYNYLKISDIRRTYLNSLTPSAVHDAIEKSGPFEEESFHEMQNRFILHHFAERLFSPFTGKGAWSKLAALDLFSNKQRFRYFQDVQDPDGHFKSDKTVSVHFASIFQISKTKAPNEIHRIPVPLNTADILEKHHTKFDDFGATQDVLNQLFTFVLKDYHQALITYPRTGERSYYESTWLHEYEQFLRKQPAEIFAPPAIWTKTSSNSPHEGIHPAESSLTPEEVRPLVRKKWYDLYKFIFEYHQKVISRPGAKMVYQYKTETTGIDSFYPVDNEVRLKSDYSVTPALKISDFLDRLVDTGALKPSGFGKTLDLLVLEQWINPDGEKLIPGPGLQKRQTQVQDFNILSELLALLHDRIPVHDLNKTALFQELSHIAKNLFKI